MFFTVLRYTPLGGGVLDSPILISPYPRSPALCCQDTPYTWCPAYEAYSLRYVFALHAQDLSPLLGTNIIHPALNILSIWQWLVISGSIRELVISVSISQYLAIFCSICEYLTVFRIIWQYLAISGSISMDYVMTRTKASPIV